MESTRYLIVGGGMTGDAAVKGIRERDADGAIVLVGAEPHPPYARPPLTKGLWSGSDEAKIWRGTEAAGADLRLGRRIVSLDLDGRRAIDDAGDEYAWEKLLLATGGRPRTIPGIDGVVYYRTLDDYREVRARAHSGTRVIVIGGGFIGSEIAASLAATDCRVTMVFPEPGIASRVFPAELSAFVTDYYRDRGVGVEEHERAFPDGGRRFVAGSIGPTNKMGSISPDVKDPAFRAVSWEDLRSSYEEQVRGLVEGGEAGVREATAPRRFAVSC